MKLNVLALVLLAFASIACSQYGATPGTDSSDRFVMSAGDGIIGGAPVVANDPISARTALLIDTRRGSICTTSILNNQWLLTAAHCVVDSQTDSLLVAFTGTLNEVISGKNHDDLRQVAEIHIHPVFVQTMNKLNAMFEAAKSEGREMTIAELDAVTDWGDIALIRINGQMPASKQAATLLPSNSLYKNQTVVLAGYGRTSTDSSAASGELHKVSVLIAEPVWGASEVLMNNSGKGACHGDSGGPSYVYSGGQYHLFGVTSRGVGDGGKCDKFSAYTSVIPYRSWIKSLSGI